MNLQQTVAAYQDGKSLSEIARMANITGEGVRQRLVKAGVARRAGGGGLGDTWSAKETQFLKRHYKRDMTASQIAKALGRTRNEVIGKAYRTIIPDAKEPAQRAPSGL